MKKYLLFTAVCFAGLVSLNSCQSKDAQTEETQEESTVAESSVEANSDAVSDLSDDEMYRPDKKVDKVTVLDFNATWCGPCKIFAPVFHEAAAKYGDKADFVSVDVDVNPQTAAAFKVQAVPTLIILTPDGKQKEYVGTQEIGTIDQISAVIDSVL